jgi:hypothetical protein
MTNGYHKESVAKKKAKDKKPKVQQMPTTRKPKPKAEN